MYLTLITVTRIQADLETIKEKIPNQRSIAQGFKLVTLPLPADYFTGRDEYLEVIKASFDFPKTSAELKRQRRFVLYGMGGIGKTQLALKFLDEHSEEYVNRLYHRFFLP